ncbi:beta-ketoacyl synthase [Microbacterium sp. MYb66]|uniref:beta-ketoacyl-[acyl-carrier-protein] synthase family protein n=1 Tax=Microbacterium sp. MYb66 TaxID=1848692 RepID=UPI000CFFCA83|nr:beta-ketoacyl-[acyl-carrier-protein] synthase family protein [Microbacterium sp. MYb66]PRA83311.1 beta-ketoacyl-[acyl-carrier-protein] synthase II [Microbacterium sp. MYb66]
MRIAITGFGAVTPVGLDAPSSWSSVLGGTSGVKALEFPWAQELPTRIAGLVDDRFAERLSVRESRRMSRVEQVALVAGREAWEHAGRPAVDGHRLGVVVGTGVGGITATLDQEHVLSTTGARRVSPHTITMLMSNGPAAWLSIDIGAKAGARTVVSACASGSEAIATGREMILSGTADVVLVGGAEAAVTGLTMASFSQMRALSKRNEDPTRASRPFDTSRDGFVLGEGAAMLVLEREAFAQARGAAVYGYVAGAATTADADDIVGADPSNQARTILLALRAAGIDPGEVGFVHAHATSTPAGDVHESAAIVASGIEAPVTSTKSMTGHLLGASGALSAMVTVLALREGVIPPTTNVEQVDPEIHVEVVRNEKRQTRANTAVVNSFGFGGHNTALVLTRS